MTFRQFCSVSSPETEQTRQNSLYDAKKLFFFNRNVNSVSFHTWTAFQRLKQSQIATQSSKTNSWLQLNVMRTHTHARAYERTTTQRWETRKDSTHGKACNEFKTFVPYIKSANTRALSTYVLGNQGGWETVNNRVNNNAYRKTCTRAGVYLKP